MADSRKRYLQMPMPPGWEVKYDFSSQKYFFIDHNTKNTAWEDPRPAYYARLERQRGGQPSPQTSSARFSQAVSSLSGSSRGAGSSSPARRPETIQLQQVVKETDIDADDDLPTLDEDEYEFAVLESKFPNASREQISKALKRANLERPDRAGGQVGRATDILRQQASEETKTAEKERELASKCRSLSADFPQLNSKAILIVLKEHDGNMYKTKEQLKLEVEAKTKALVSRYPSVQPTLIAELQREAASRSDGDTYLESRLEFLQAEATPSAPAEPTTPRQRHPSPQPRSVVEGEDSLERQRAHRQLVVELSREFPRLEMALVRSTLASVNWSLQKGREKLQVIRHSLNNTPVDRSASPASMSSRGPSPNPHQVVRPSPTPQKTHKKNSPKPKKTSPKARVKSAGKKGTSKKFVHKTVAKGSDPTLAAGHDKNLSNGPDASLHHGPDPSLRDRSNVQLSQGADPVLRQAARTRN